MLEFVLRSLEVYGMPVRYAHAMRSISILAALFLFLSTASGQGDYDVVWNTPGTGPGDSMPLGNGDIGLNAWVEGNGDLVFYIGKTDAWGDNGRLLKVGRVRVTLDPRPRVEGVTFEQRLRLERGTMTVRFGEGEDAVRAEVWVDAQTPVIHVTAMGPEPMTATAAIELWRLEPEELPSIEVSDVMLHRSHPDGWYAPTVVEPDTVLTELEEGIGWYHHNRKSVGPELIAKIQGTSGFERVDPLLHRTFGAVIRSPGATRVDGTHLRSPRGTAHRFDVYVHTAHPATPAAWLQGLNEVITAVESRAFEMRHYMHEVWWSNFWGRSSIDVTLSSASPPPVFVPGNDHPVRIGIDQSGGNRFVGEISRVSIFERPLSDKEVAGLARIPRDEAVEAGDDLRMTRRGAKPASVADSTSWTFEQGLTVEAWIRPGKLPAGGGRIVDKVTPGVDDGLLFDTWPGNSLRLITALGTLSRKDVLPRDSWVHVAAVVDPGAGTLALHLEGEVLARETVDTTDDAFTLSRAYALQRFIDACAGRGAWPIKFNGSIFTVPSTGKPGDADYRRWGPGYWWQNTRLPYLSMCASGDFEMMKPLFAMYSGEVLRLAAHRTRRYFDHEGAFIPECIYFWGDVFSESYGWTPFEKRGPDKLQESGWHKWEWVSGLELVWMMLEFYEHTLDEGFLKETLLPTAHQVLTFFDQHYARDDRGKLVMHPAQALETWWDCTDPMPEIAGLHAVSARLLALPPELTGTEQRAFWRGLRHKVPDLPTREKEGALMLAPAARYENKRNIENPELYAVFPFRLVSFEKENVPLGRRALEHRWDRGNFGWRQDEVFMAYLGLAEEARANLVKRAKNSHRGSRFPAFWGPNYDWVPDQDHGGILMKALQAMLLQSDGDVIHLLPAWPRDWDVAFKLHAPRRTVIQCEVAGGKIRGLGISPPERLKDVVVSPAWRD